LGYVGTSGAKSDVIGLFLLGDPKYPTSDEISGLSRLVSRPDAGQTTDAATETEGSHTKCARA